MVSLYVFDGKTGAHVSRLSWTSLSWSDSINEAGSISATVEDPGFPIRCYGHILAALDGSDVLHAGYVTKATEDRSKGTVSIEGGGGLTILDKRIVLNRLLKTQWKDGTVLIDEDNPPGAWVLELSGSYRDIVRGLVAETLQWGTLPISLPAVQGGSHERTYNCWDLATVSSRISDIGDLEDGPEIRLDPSLDGDWNLTFALNVADEVVDTTWRWNALLPGQEISPGAVDFDGAYMATQSFGTGGKNDDTLVVAHAVGGSLEADGWPVLQVANTSHTTISQTSTLRKYVNADVAAGDTPQESRSMTCPMSLRVRVGDWAELRDEAGVGSYKVTDVSGDAAKGRLTVSLRPRG